jgi:DNA helicase-2/ATP-dependent DNA helicase PcrA
VDGPDPEALLIDLDPRQREAVTSPATPLAILAPAGSGKTRVITRRIAWRVMTGDAEAQHVLALTFTRKAASELGRRLRDLGLRSEVAAGTFHAIAYAQLRARWVERGWSAPTLLPHRTGLIAQLPSVRKARISAAEVATEIDWAKARLIAADRYAEAAAAARRRTPTNPERLAGIYADYEETKRARRLVDFDDLLRICIDAMESDEVFASTQRWRFRHLFVDEFQDVNPLQLRLLEAWRGSHYDLCVVGDPHQAIYGWNGADARYLVDFRALYPPAEIITLEHNYRSTPQILAAASAVLLASRLEPHEVRATLADGDAPAIEAYESDIEESRAVARAVRDRHTPRSRWSEQAILVRTHAQTALLHEAMRASGIPARVRGTAPLLEQEPARDALARLREHDGPLAALVRDLEEEALELDDPAALLTLAELAREHLRVEPRATGAGFAAWVAASTGGDSPDRTGDAVEIATFHAAKGLEWPIVHIAGIEDGLVPITHARTRAARAEEARLLHVAMTRAQRELRCTWAARRTFGTRVVDRQVSPLLRPIIDAQRSQPVAVDEGWRERLAEQRAALHSAATTASPAAAALQRWRDQAARAARIEPQSLLTDRVLAAIADGRPRDVDELAVIPGVGRLLATRFGDDILAALNTSVG